MNRITGARTEYDLAGKVIGLAMRVHAELGPGFLESVYANALMLELARNGLSFENQRRLPVTYRGECVGEFFCDLLVENQLIVELKAVSAILPAHEAQTVNYLAATGIDDGLILNFGTDSLTFKRKFRSFRPTNSLHSANSVNSVSSAFTILELLVAMAVMALLLVVLMNMVDSATKLWRTSENRVDSYREARAALGIIARDLQNTVSANNTRFFAVNDSSAFGPLPVEAVKNDTNMAGAVFFLSALPATAQAQGERSDVCRVGYFLAHGPTSMAPNSISRTMNIYRYFSGSNATFSALGNASSTGSPFSSNLTLTSSEVELLARNVTRFTITPLTIGNGTVTTFTQSSTTPVPDLLEISVSAINTDAARKLGNSRNAWIQTNAPPFPNVARPVEQTFTTRIRLNRPPPN